MFFSNMVGMCDGSGGFGLKLATIDSVLDLLTGSRTLFANASNRSPKSPTCGVVGILGKMPL